MKKMKKICFIGFLFLVVIPTSGLEDRVLYLPQNSQDPIIPFIYGAPNLVYDLDPHYAWDSASFDHIFQVCEGLLAYRTDDPDMQIEPRLAADFGVWAMGSPGFHTDQWTYTIELKNGVKFHDGSSFGPEDVVYSFDRLNEFCTSETPTQIATLYMPLASQYPATPLLINRTDVVDAMHVQFTLNYKFVPFESLLCFSGSVILPENKYSTSEYMNTQIDTLVGTGPYQQILNTEDQTIFQYFIDYHRAEPSIKIMHWNKYPDWNILNQDFLAGKIDFCGSLDLDMMDDYERSDLLDVGTRMQGTTMYYLAFNCDTIDLNTRKAMQDATNYSYIINDLGAGELGPLSSPVPKGILYHNDSIPNPTLDLYAARTHILDALAAGEEGLTEPGGFALTPESSDVEWEAVTLGTFNYSFNTGNDRREAIGYSIEETFAKIGLNVNVEGKDWSEYIMSLIGGTVQIHMNGWGADYNDPSNYLNNLFLSTSPSNYANLDDSALDQKMADALLIEDPGAREIIYHELQQDIIDLAPWSLLYTSNTRSVYSADLRNPHRNPMNFLVFYEMIWAKQPILDSDNDGLTDYKELFCYNSDPNNPDSDTDGLSDGLEVILGTELKNNDTDADDLLDGAEFYYYTTSPLLNDTDGDKLNDGEEVLMYHTDPKRIDTDNDGLDDYVELRTHQTNPLLVDTDNDNLLDDFELKFGTDPKDDDSDDDGYFDGYEVKMGKNPLDANSYPGDDVTTTSTDTSTSTETSETTDTTETSDSTETTATQGPFEDFLSKIPGYPVVSLLVSVILVSVIYAIYQNKKFK